MRVSNHITPESATLLFASGTLTWLTEVASTLGHALMAVIAAVGAVGTLLMGVSGIMREYRLRSEAKRAADQGLPGGPGDAESV